MDIEQLHAYCLSLPHVTECFPFDDVSLVVKVHGKMFGLIPLDSQEPCIALKCDAERAICLREDFEAVTPAHHFNKKYWNTLWLNLAPNDDFIRENVLHSYKQVVMKLPQKLRPAYAATIGFFDGVHCGHRYLLSELKRIAAQKGLDSMAITFGEHPRKVLCNDFQPKLLTDNEEKLFLLKQTGVDVVETLDFDTEMATLTAADFMRFILSKQLNVKLLLLGYDHRFGSDRLTDFADYERLGKKYGIEVRRMEQYVCDGQHVSSSAIRHLLEAGDVAAANVLLGHRFQLTGIVVDGRHIGRTIGFPTANLCPINREKVIPAAGVYVVDAEMDGKLYRGMLNIGTCPTVDGNTQSIEVHLLDFQSDLYGQTLTVQFRKRLRSEIKFASVDDLQRQLEQDAEQVRDDAYL